MLQRHSRSLARPEYVLDINSIEQYPLIRRIYKNVCLNNDNYSTSNIIEYLDEKGIIKMRKVYMNGALIDEIEAKLSVYDSAYVWRYGFRDDSIFWGYTI